MSPEWSTAWSGLLGLNTAAVLLFVVAELTTRARRRRERTTTEAAAEDPGSLEALIRLVEKVEAESAGAGAAEACRETGGFLPPRTAVARGGR